MYIPYSKRKGSRESKETGIGTNAFKLISMDSKSTSCNTLDKTFQ